ncbi:NAD(P)/FAD-dependent oxidoreductase [Corynebacterium sp. 22KM0430]|uniref:NAD(P)/FAD-dependent oxidoreductase n=1 Tax=Corynebacterium sp. 22KM0430 TaxID=2989735 RepID=UPI0029CA8DB7|nr:NAD(P)/FAD-dependent oxidoreductase [Corynebacterium sp. 22KM0430]WPF65384.1 NAD(P)/FAD-dependent oxidoreductase [Corynebacterium sp. 22KM0430]
MTHHWDLIIIGGSAAGVAAALTSGRSLRRTLVIDAGAPRNRYAAHMHNVVGFDGKEPVEFVAAGRVEAQAYGVEFVSGTVTRLAESEGGMEVTFSTDSGAVTHRVRRVLLATGAVDVLPEIPGIEQHWGSGALHCPYCHGYEVAHKRLGVIATSPMSDHQAKLLTQWTSDLTWFTQGGEWEAMEQLRAHGVSIVPEPVTELVGEPGSLTAVRTTGGEYPVDAVFVGTTLRLDLGFAKELNLATTQTPMGEALEVNQMGQTSHPLVYAAGNVCNPGAIVSVAAGAGSQAAAVVNAMLVEEDMG